ncbi:MAG: hypothetical protein IJS78_03805 [Clostridia bacterium]|nr:hypothetical protein [Clostridia bacterium]
MTLLRAEWKKLFSSRAAIVLILLFLIVNFAVSFAYAKRDETFFCLKDIRSEYERDPEAVTEYYGELRERNDEFGALLAEYAKGNLKEEPVLEFPCKYSGDPEADDFSLLTLFFRDRNSEFDKTISSLVDKAVLDAAELLSTGGERAADTFAYRRQTHIRDVYSAVRERVTVEESAYGWDQFFSFDTSSAFIAVVSFITAGGVFLSEKGNASLILRVSKKGGARTAAAKVSALALFSLCVAVIFPASSLFAVYLKCGALSSPFGYAAGMEGSALTPYPLTVLGYLALYVLSKIALAVASSLFSAAVCVLIRGRTAGFLVSAGIAATGFIGYGTGIGDGAKYLNAVGISRFTEMLSVTRPVNVFGHAVEVFAVALVSLGAISLASAVFLIIAYPKMRLGGVSGAEKKRLSAFFSRIRRAGTKKRRSVTGGIVRFELFKLASNRAVAVVLLAVVLIGAYSAAHDFKEKNTMGRAIYAEYVETLKGAYSEEKERYLYEESDRIAGILNKYEANRAAFFSGVMSPDDYGVYLAERADASEREPVVHSLLERCAALRKTTEKTGVPVCFTFDLDWERLLTKRQDAILIVLVIFVAATIFTTEYREENSLPLIRSTKNGRGALLGKKLVLSFCSGCVLSAIFETVYAVAATGLVLPDGGVPLCSLAPYASTGSGMSIYAFVAISAVARVALAGILSVSVTATGVFLKNPVFLIGASALAVYLPGAVASLGFRAARYCDFSALLDVRRAFGIGAGKIAVSAALFAALCAALIVSAYLKYAGREKWN